MTQVFLHIGQSKTCTTSIQGCLLKNEKLLLSKYKTLYPDALRPKRSRIHTDLVLLAKDYAGIENLRPANQSILRRNILSYGVDDKGSFDRFVGKSRKQFLMEVESKKPERIVLSSELMWRHLTTNEEISRLQQLLCKVSDDVTIVVYLRRQDERMISNFSQAVKLGNPGNKSLENAASKIFPYLENLDTWSAVFGIDRMVVRVFERDQLKGRDAVVDFFSVIGIPENNMVRDLRGNERLDLRKVEILKSAFPGKSLRGDFTKEELRRWRKLVLKLEKMEPLGPPIQLSDDVRKRVLANHAETNEKIARKYLGRENGKLFSSPE